MGVDIRIALTLFTVLAPAGALAYLFMALRIFIQPKRNEKTELLEHFLMVPLGVSILGLISSATHLGTPANSLYVLMGWGRSPLSNEVTVAVIFLMLTGMYWLYSFVRSKRLPWLVVRFWLISNCLAALWLVTMISVVYAIPTIPTWNSALVPLELWVLALSTGPLLAAAILSFMTPKAPRSYLLALLGISACAIVASLIVFSMKNVELNAISNAWGSAHDLVPWYPLSIVTWAVLGVFGLLFIAVSVLREQKDKSGAGFDKKTALFSFGGIALVFAGAILIRIPFYMMHLTVGL
ncbi:MAG: dimethyl sulfoxide reductase anchor subunit [Eggerthellaceae bacterium]|nr:dimethyl sulfoxide reductase anchor subunit [Eggerthellaceae bacterium]